LVAGGGGAPGDVEAGVGAGADHPRPEEVAEYQAAFREVYADAERSRRKDISRGRRIIDDYEEVRPPVEEDPVLEWLREELGSLGSRVQRFLDDSAGDALS
jgi:hypothetical protein